MMKQTFKLEEVLSAVKGVLLCKIGKVYEVLDFLTGDNIYTHQLPRVARTCEPHVLKQHPFLNDIDLSGINTDNWQERLAEIKNKYPNEIELIQIGDFLHKDPYAELVDMVVIKTGL